MRILQPAEYPIWWLGFSDRIINVVKVMNGPTLIPETSKDERSLCQMPVLHLSEQSCYDRTRCISA